MEAQVVTIDQPFHCAYEKFIEITDHLSAEMAGDKTHSDIEAYLETDGRELLRLLLQDHLDNQGSGRSWRQRCVARTGWCARINAITWKPAIRVCLVPCVWRAPGYSQRGVTSLFPRDAQLNLPAQWLLASVAEAGGRQGRQDVL